MGPALGGGIGPKDGLALPWGVHVPPAQPPSTEGSQVSGDGTAESRGEADSHRWETPTCSTWHPSQGTYKQRC